ncbi:hypothetical protein KKB44_05380 [Candidatus Micrarchaeota archaeon]|nr:hypothetical protein [Candidatus Micrarchaeota archaeon]
MEKVPKNARPPVEGHNPRSKSEIALPVWPSYGLGKEGLAMVPKDRNIKSKSGPKGKE